MKSRAPLVYTHMIIVIQCYASLQLILNVYARACETANGKQIRLSLHMMSCSYWSHHKKSNDQTANHIEAGKLNIRLTIADFVSFNMALNDG